MQYTIKYEAFTATVDYTWLYNLAHYIFLTTTWLCPCFSRAQEETLGVIHVRELSPFRVCCAPSYLYKWPGDQYRCPGVPTARCFPRQSQDTTYTRKLTKTKITIAYIPWSDKQLSHPALVPKPNTKRIFFFPTEKVNTARHLLSNHAFHINVPPLERKLRHD